MKRYYFLLPFVTIRLFSATVSTVTTASGDPSVVGSLPYRINNSSASETINYDIPGDGPFTTDITSNITVSGKSVFFQPYIVSKQFYQDVSLKGSDFIVDGTSELSWEGFRAVSNNFVLQSGSKYSLSGATKTSHIPLSTFSGKISGDCDSITVSKNVFITGKVKLNSGELVKNSDGKATFTNTLSLPGKITLSGGNLVLSGALADLTNDVVFQDTVSPSVTTLTLGSTKSQLLSGDFSAAKKQVATIVKENTGKTTLSGALNIPGTITIDKDGGTLLLSGDISNCTTNFSLGKSGVLEIGTGSSSKVLSGDISGDGEVKVEGSGELELSGTLSYTGATTVSSGTSLSLFKENTAVAFSSDISLESNSTLNVGVSESGVRQLFFGGLSGSGDLVKLNKSISEFLGPVSLTGDIFVRKGDLGLGGAISDYKGTITVDSGAIFGLGGIAEEQTISGVIKGEGALAVFTGTEVIASGVSTISGGVSIENSATLSVTGSIKDSDVEIASGGSLKGTGSVGTITAKGTVQPGNSIGTLHVVGDYIQSSGSKLEVEFNTTSTDLLFVTGGASIADDSTLLLIPDDNQSFYGGQTLTFLNAAGGVFGQYSTIDLANNNSLDINQFQVKYSDNLVQLVFLPDFHVQNSVYIQGVLGLQSSLAQLNNFQSLNNRNLYSFDWCQTSKCTDDKSCEPYPCRNQGWDFFLLTSYSGQNQEMNSSRPSGHYKSATLTTGAEYVFSEAGLVGMGFGYTYGQGINQTSLESKTTSDAFTFGMNALYSPIKYLAFDFAGNIDKVWYSSRRQTTVHKVQAEAKSNPEGLRANAKIRANGRFCLATMLFQPFFGSTYSWSKVDGYSEKGPLHQTYKVGDNSLSYWHGEGGVMISRIFRSGDICVIPHVNTSYVFRYNKPTEVVTLQNIGVEDPIGKLKYKIEDVITNYLIVGAGVDFLNKERFRVYIEANGFIKNQLNSSLDARLGFDIYF